jgi:hypothetical protein
VRKVQTLNRKYDTLEEALKESIIFERKFKMIRRNLQFETLFSLGEQVELNIEIYEP